MNFSFLFRPERKKTTRVTVSGPYKYRQGQRDGPEDFKITGYPRPARQGQRALIASWTRLTSTK